MSSIYGTKLTDKEYQQAITNLVQITPNPVPKGDEDLWDMIELAIMAHHRLGIFSQTTN